VAPLEQSDLGLRLSGRSWPLKGIALGMSATVLAFLVGALLIVAAGGHPIPAYGSLLDGALGSRLSIGQLMVQTTPLLIIALGLAFAFRGRVYNIGAEGQLFMGALAGGTVAVFFPASFAPASIALAMLAGIAGGAAWGSIVGVLRARWRVNEVISSLLLNYVAAFIFSYLVRKPLRDPAASFLVGKTIQNDTKLPAVPEFPAHSGFLVAVAIVPVAAYVLERTPFGFRVGMMGLNPEAARVAGVDTPRMIVRLMLISGGLAGLAGVIQVLGVTFRLDPALSQGYGFTAIVVALLGRLRALGVLAGALFIGGLTVGGQAMSVDQGLPFALVLAIQGVFVIFILIADRFARAS
jgi:general nucleoside transport system permease protein